MTNLPPLPPLPQRHDGSSHTGTVGATSAALDEKKALLAAKRAGTPSPPAAPTPAPSALDDKKARLAAKRAGAPSPAASATAAVEHTDDADNTNIINPSNAPRKEETSAERAQVASLMRLVTSPTKEQAVAGAKVAGRASLTVGKFSWKAAKVVWQKLTPLHPLIFIAVIPSFVLGIFPIHIALINAVLNGTGPFFGALLILGLWIHGIRKTIRGIRSRKQTRGVAEGPVSANDPRAKGRQVTELLLTRGPLLDFYTDKRNYMETVYEPKPLTPQQARQLRSKGLPAPTQARQVENREARLADARRNIKIRFTESDDKGNLTLDAYEVWLDLNGEEAEKVRKFMGSVKGILRLNSIELIRGDELEHLDSRGFVRFAAYEKPKKDLLYTNPPGSDFFEKNPAINPMKVPMGITDKGGIYYLDIHHTLCAGQTGSGKGSFGQAIVRQMVPFIRQGKVWMVGIDPKRSEFMPFRDSLLFKKIPMLIEKENGTDDDPYERDENGVLIGSSYYRVAFTVEEQINTIKWLHAIMKERSATNTSRSFTPSRRRPMIVVNIDEYGSLRKEKRFQKEAAELMFAVMAQGRSLGIFILAMTQNVTADVIGADRINFVNAVALKQKFPNHSELVMGKDAIEQGAAPHDIPASTPANKFRHSGIFFAISESEDSDDSGSVVRGRLAYTDDAFIEHLEELYMDPDGREEREALRVTEANTLLGEERFRDFINLAITKGIGEGDEKEKIDPIEEKDFRRGRISSLYSLYEEWLDEAGEDLEGMPALV